MNHTDKCIDLLSGRKNEGKPLAQFEEMESAEKPLTWNDRINQMTVEEKAKWFDAHMDWCPFDECAENQNCEKCYAKFLASPYTEGATK